ncbi:TfuA-like protein [Microvirga calopogonii]|uniref:TfuA-like protein n=1 Tax=Microvirga calopogonii TaxID=2078013 RepID=UPI0013B41683|nr:TfuA domain-containing protein [Microvirga calopogonii]
MEAIRDGASCIALIDGAFETQASVWHKEILYALSGGVPVFGASSIGALRAAECHTFGMEGVGKVFEDFRSGKRTADDDVAVIHAPAELSYHLLTEALVDLEATIDHLAASMLLDVSEATHLRHEARGLHFKHRTWDSILDKSGFDPDRTRAIRALLIDHRISQKERDALQLINILTQAGPQCRISVESERCFEFNRTGFIADLEKAVFQRHGQGRRYDCT